jgi:hypothetical protein
MASPIPWIYEPGRAASFLSRVFAHAANEKPLSPRLIVSTNCNYRIAMDTESRHALAATFCRAPQIDFAA